MLQSHTTSVEGAGDSVAWQLLAIGAVAVTVAVAVADAVAGAVGGAVGGAAAACC